jgi:hypothetical protein
MTETKNFPPKTVLFHEGDRYNGLYIIIKGEVEIYKQREGIDVPLTTLKGGDVLGTLTVLSKSDRTANARALSEVQCVFISPEQIDQSFQKDVPIWGQAVIKDAIARIHDLDNQLVKIKLQEKKYIQKLGNNLHLISKILSFLAFALKTGIIEEEGQVFYPMKHFYPTCEGIFLESAERIEKLMDGVFRSGLLQLQDHKKYGSVIMKPNINLVQDFIIFAVDAARKGNKDFLSLRLQPYASALIRIYKAEPQVKVYHPEDLLKLLAKQIAGKEPSLSLMQELIQAQVLKLNQDKDVSFQAQSLQKRIIFESCCRLLDEIGQS